jgi:trans-aconitate 2-methyltransferase
VSWSASQYVKFEDERTRPALELLERVRLDHPVHAIDLGCGPGNSTELIARRFPQVTVEGMDSDENMLTAARERLPELSFFKADLAHWQPAKTYDLMFANAVFQWLPNHLDIVLTLMEGLSSGGVFAFQMPDNLDESSHLLMEESAQAGSWRTNFKKSVRRNALASPSHYYEGLKTISRNVDIWHTHYYHVMQGPEAIVEWVKGTGLQTYLQKIPAEQQSDFLADYTARIAKAYPAMADGHSLFRFPRLFMVATRA